MPSSNASIKLSSILGTTVRTTSATIGFDKTFDPEGRDVKGVSRWVDRSGGIAIGYPNLSMSMRRPTVGSRLWKAQVKLALPTMDVTSPSTGSGIQPAPSKAYENACVMEWLLPERGTSAERLILFNLVHSLFASTINANDDLPTDATGNLLLAMVQNLDPNY